MLKRLVVMILLVSPLISQARPNAVVCRSSQPVNGWTGVDTEEVVLFTAYVDSDTSLSKAQVKGAFVSDVRDLEADSKYRPRNPRYRDFSRFDVLEDAWCWFWPLLPKDLASQPKGSRFDGYLQMVCEEGRNRQTIDLSCSIR